ncbi:MAG: response regulator transcription factor [Bacteroidota bacterium]|nr:response regulator transcription factor [Bacteroidota bacterium]MDP4212543.1 response regulator transcription factor [Bacteroidota bacterium]MDP4250499.1 response regulator transcription factor [Bacteroidota bacterium]
MRRFLLADDHSVVRLGLKQILLEGFPSAEILEASDAEAVIERVSSEKLDIVISDISMPGRSGLEILSQIRTIQPGLPVLMLSVYPEDQYAARVLKAGASGYLNKDSPPDELIRAVNAILFGKRYITAAVAEKLAETLDKGGDKLPHEYLSNREFQVLKLLGSGTAVSEIARRLSLNITTISTYRSRIFKKMSLDCNANLTMYVAEHKLI